jgi:prepilin-type N-terminal cleavage/methylation domain-containing protein
MKRKGFTLVELLVVIAIIALLMSILMPALARVRALAQRVVCGAHLSSIGKQLIIYSNDYDDKYPRAGGRDSKWGPTGPLGPSTAWAAAPTVGEPGAYGVYPNNYATVGACLFYLIKYADASPKSFICGSDIGAKVFKLSDYPPNTVYNDNIVEAWDFGPTDFGVGRPNSPRVYYSYAYQYPFPQLGKPGYFPISPLSESGIAIMADSSPYIALTFDTTWKYFKRKNSGTLTSCRGGTDEKERFGNSPNHKGEGQNVMYNDNHISWYDVPYCGFENDNIYSLANICKNINQPDIGTIYTPNPTPATPTLGRFPSTKDDTHFFPITKVDSILVNEGFDQGGIDPTG